MKNKFTKNLCLFCCVFILAIGSYSKANTTYFPQTYSQDPIDVNLSTEWQEYSFTDGVLIEYRMEKMNSRDYGREVNMVVFRFTNTTDQLKDCSWAVKIERNNKCYNCESLGNTEEIFNLQLDPKETVEGNESNLMTQSELNIFGNFVKLVPGMSEQKLTAFELINLTIK